MKRKSFKTFLLIIIISMSVRAMAAVPMIKPGKGIADLKLNDNIREIINKFEKEKPDFAQIIKRKTFSETLLFYTKRGIIFVCDPKGKVKRMIVNSPSLFLEKSLIRVGSTLEHVQKAYSAQADTLSTNIYISPDSCSTGNYTLYSYLSRGLIFTVRDNKVVSITVLEPDEIKTNAEFTNRFNGIMGVGNTWKELLYTPFP